jgi:hypothetical protein
VLGCGSKAPNPGDGDSDGGGGGGAADAPPCPTAITGKVFAPNGTLPLYDVLVYAPIGELEPLPVGVTCSQCSAPPSAYATTRTDAEGNFRLEGIPPGTDVPVVLSTGKWRRKLTIPQVAACTDTAVPDGELRLPRNKSEGDLPHIAVVTGGCDALACIFSKLGIDNSEFGTSSNGPTSVVFYSGSHGSSPGSPQPAAARWGSLDELKKFDMVINTCECSENNGNKTSPDVLRQYADMGGRVFGSHYHYTWTKNLVPAWRGAADWTSGAGQTPDLVDTSHPGGMALAQWLVAVGASTTLGQIELGIKSNDSSTVNAPAVRWLHSSGTPATSHYLSFTTPFGASPENTCGKVVFAGMHVSSGDTVGPSFPQGCSAELTPDEKALVFLLFDLGACVNVLY